MMRSARSAASGLCPSASAGGRGDAALPDVPGPVGERTRRPWWPRACAASSRSSWSPAAAPTRSAPGSSTGYGPWILLSPTPSGLGWTLWLLPALAVSAGGVVAAMAVRRRRDRAGATQDRDLDAVEEALSACAAGTLSVPDTPAGERLESSLLLLSSVRADRATGLSSAHAEALAAARVADALALVPAPHSSPLLNRPDHASRCAPPSGRPASRRAALGRRGHGVPGRRCLQVRGRRCSGIWWRRGCRLTHLELPLLEQRRLSCTRFDVGEQQ